MLNFYTNFFQKRLNIFFLISDFNDNDEKKFRKNSTNSMTNFLTKIDEGEKN